MPSCPKVKAPSKKNIEESPILVPFKNTPPVPNL